MFIWLRFKKEVLLDNIATWCLPLICLSKNYCLKNEISLSSISPYLADKDYYTVLDKVSKTFDSKTSLQVTDIKSHSKIDGE